MFTIYATTQTGHDWEKATWQNAYLLGLFNHKTKLITGTFRGTHEHSMRIDDCSWQDVEFFSKLFCVLYKQECIMVVDAAKRVWFIDKTGAIGSPVGILKQQAAAPAFGVDYSFDGEFYYTLEFFDESKS